MCAVLMEDDFTEEPDLLPVIEQQEWQSDDNAALVAIIIDTEGD